MPLFGRGHRRLGSYDKENVDGGDDMALPIGGNFIFKAGDAIGLTFDEENAITKVESMELKRKFQPGDVLVSINGRNITGDANVSELIAQAIEESSGQLSLTALRKRRGGKGTL